MRTLSPYEEIQQEKKWRREVNAGKPPTPLPVVKPVKEFKSLPAAAPAKKFEPLPLYETVQDTLRNLSRAQQMGLSVDLPKTVMNGMSDVVVRAPRFVLPMPTGRNEQEMTRAESRQLRQLASGMTPARLTDQAQRRDAKIWSGLTAYYSPEEIAKRRGTMNAEIEALKRKQQQLIAINSAVDYNGPTPDQIAPKSLTGGLSAGEALRAVGKDLTQKTQAWDDALVRDYLLKSGIQLASVQADPVRARQYGQGKELIADLRNLAALKDDAAHPSGDPKMNGYRRYFEQKYGLTQEALDNYARSVNAGLPPTATGGTYDSAQDLYDELERTLTGLKEGVGKNGKTFNDLYRYENLVESARKSAEADEEARRLAREEPGMASLSTLLSGPLKPMEVGAAYLGNQGHNDPLDPENYVPLNVYDMSATNFGNTVRKTITQDLLDAGHPFKAMGYNMAMNMGDYALVSSLGPTGATIVTAAEALADKTRGAVYQGKSNRLALSDGLNTAGAFITLNTLLRGVGKTAEQSGALVDGMQRDLAVVTSGGGALAKSNAWSNLAASCGAARSALSSAGRMADHAVVKEMQNFLDVLGGTAAQAGGGNTPAAQKPGLSELFPQQEAPINMPWSAGPQTGAPGNPPLFLRGNSLDEWNKGKADNILVRARGDGDDKVPDADVKMWVDEGWSDKEAPSVRGPEKPESVDVPGDYDIMGTGTRGKEILYERSLREAQGEVSPYHNINIHGVRNSELDEVDLPGHVIYEDKDASKLYMENPDVPQSEEHWAQKQIYRKTKNRILALQQQEFRMSSEVSSVMPPIDNLKAIRTFIFRIGADAPEIRAVVQTAIDQLKQEFPEYEFYAVFGGN